MQDVAKAILLERDNFVLQLRDNKPLIETPDMWSLFGGGIKPTESAEEAIVRETQEELCITLQDYQPLYNFKYLAEYSLLLSRNIGCFFIILSFQKNMTHQYGSLKSVSLLLN